MDSNTFSGLNEYQRAALRTWQTDWPARAILAHRSDFVRGRAGLGLVAAGGDVAEAAKKSLFHDKPLAAGNLRLACHSTRQQLAALEAPVMAERMAACDVLELPAPLLALERLNAALGVAGEAGEVAKLLDAIYTGEMDEAHIEALVDELGDMLYYVAVLAHTVGVPLADIAAANQAKLQARHPNGFSTSYITAEQGAA